MRRIFYAIWISCLSLLFLLENKLGNSSFSKPQEQVSFGIAEDSDWPQPKEIVDTNSYLLRRVEFTDDKPKHIWTTELNRLPEVKNTGPVDANTRFFLTFTDNSHLAVGLFFPLRVNGILPGRTPAQRSRTLILMVDGLTGKTLHFRGWNDFQGEPAVIDGYDMRPANTNELLVVVGNDVLRLSPELEVLAQRSLVRSAQEKHGLTYYDYWNLVASPAGNFALLIHKGLDECCENHWISTRNLADDKRLVGPNSLSSTLLMENGAIVFNTAGDAHHRLFASKLEHEGPPQLLCSSCGAVFTAFGKDLILLGLAQHSVSYIIVDIDGTEFYRTNLGHGADRVLQVSGSSATNRVALLCGSLRTSFLRGWRDTNRIVVLDADVKHKVVEIDSSGEGEHPGNDWQVFNTPRLALSPDGTRLAILRGSTLELLAIP